MDKHAYKIRLFIAFIIIILIVLAFYGLLYPVKLLDWQFTPLVERTIFNFSISATFTIIILFVLTALFGRFYCSILCPFGIMQELLSLIFKTFKIKSESSKKNYGFKYVITTLGFGVLVGGSTIIIRYIDPYTIFGNIMSFTIIGILSFIVISVLVMFKNRFFCTNICPVGTIFGLISKKSLNKIYIDDNCISCGMCIKSCPSGCINKEAKHVNNETCLKCLKCVSICKKGAIKYGHEKN